MDEIILNFQIAILTLVGTIFFAIISTKIKRLLIYLPAYVLLPFGFLFVFMQYLNNIYRIVGNLFLLASLISLIIDLFIEFFHYSQKDGSVQFVKNNKQFLIFLLSPSLISLMSIQITILLLLIFAIGLNLKLYLKFKLFRHMALLIFLLIAGLTGIATISSAFEIPGAWEFSYLANIIFSVYYLFFPFLIYFEEKVNTFKKNIEMEKSRANIYFELAGDIMVGLDLEGKIVLLNKQGYDIFGYKKDELLNQDYFIKLIPQKISARLRKAFNQAINQGLDIDRYYINEILTKSGEERLIKWYNALIYDHIGNVQGMLSSGIDITEQKEVERKLKTSETNFKNIVENASNIIVVSGYEGDQMYVSPRFTQLLGWPYEQPNILFDIMHPDDQEKFLTRYRKAVKNRKALTNEEMELRLKDVNGNYIWFSSITKDFYDKDGTIKGFITSLQDISERKHAESKLKETERYFQNIIENSTDAILVTDFGGKHTYISPQYSKIIGYDQNEVKGVMYNLIHPDDREKIFLDFQKAQSEKKAFESEEITLRIKHKDGHYVWVSTISKDYYNENGEVIGIITSMRDITERKLAEERQKQAEEQFRQIFESNPAGIHIYELNEDGKLIFKGANPAADKILALNHKNFIDKSIEEAFPEFIGVRKVDYFQNLTLEKNYFNFNQISYNEHTYEENIFYISPTSICISFIDITERLKVEKELIELDRMKRDLLRRASHELKTPLVSIIGAVELLLNTYKSHFDENVEYYLNIIQSGGSRLKRLIESLIDVSQLESRKIEVNKTIEDVTKIVSNSVEEVRFFADERNIKINFSEQNSYNIKLDNDKMQEVITNLLMNAIKYTPPQGRIFINIKDVDLDFIEISVKDTGIGFTEEEKLKIFKEFGKIERYGQGMLLNTEGIGLGLFISKEIVDLHGGTITLESEGRYKGSNFIVKLPKY